MQEHKRGGSSLLGKHHGPQTPVDPKTKGIQAGRSPTYIGPRYHLGRHKSIEVDLGHHVKSDKRESILWIDVIIALLNHKQISWVGSVVPQPTHICSVTRYVDVQNTAQQPSISLFPLLINPSLLGYLGFVHSVVPAYIKIGFEWGIAHTIFKKFDELITPLMKLFSALLLHIS